MIRIPCLLAMPRYPGTLAAVRQLGQHGIPVTLAGTELLAPARWSRYATQWVRCPPVADADRWLDWILAFGDREPRHVLCASSDDLSFLIAANEAELAKRFFVYQPPIGTIVRALDKKALLDACACVGIDMVPTWFPADEADLPRIAREAEFPVILKARTQVRRARQSKGGVVTRAEDLPTGYQAFMADHAYLPGLERHFGDVSQPMIQRYYPDAAKRVYSITGFIDRSGEVLGTRAAIKVFQRTEPVGLGLCFEAAPVDDRLADEVARLCRELGHVGVFEVEFLRDGDRAMVIDFNPRFYGQMGFDAARGLPLALMAYLAALGDEESLERCAAAAARATGGAAIYTHRFAFELLLLARRFGRTLSSSEYEGWREWYARRQLGAADASADDFDRMPGVVHAASEVQRGLLRLGRLSSWR